MERRGKDNKQTKKLTRPTVRPFNTAVYMLRCKQLGFTLLELFDMEYGEIFDLMTESANDRAQWDYKAQQSDFDSVFH